MKLSIELTGPIDEVITGSNIVFLPLQLKVPLDLDQQNLEGCF
jgi:hypothetical protein